MAKLKINDYLNKFINKNYLDPEILFNMMKYLCLISRTIIDKSID